MTQLLENAVYAPTAGRYKVYVIDEVHMLSTHAFNAMPGIHHRAPGPILAAMRDDRVTLELIADGFHVHPDVIALAFAGAPGRIALITDAMAAAGAPDGDYELGGLPVRVTDGQARLVENGAIAGSTLTQDAALRLVVAGGLPLADAVAAAIDDDTVAVLFEPIQGEAGIVVPPADFLPRVRQICTERNVLMIADEIQSGLARTGHTFACQHWGVEPDMYLLGKALGGGVVPVSAVVANADILGVLHPGEHGSTFGGNPMAAAVGTTVVQMLATGEYQRRATELGKHLHTRLEALIGHGVLAVRGMGLWAGVDIDPELGTGKHISMLLAQRGVLVKDTHGSTLRFAPPLVITDEEIDWAIDQFTAAMDEARVENMKRTS